LNCIINGCDEKPTGLDNNDQLISNEIDLSDTEIKVDGYDIAPRDSVDLIISENLTTPYMTTYFTGRSLDSNAKELFKVSDEFGEYDQECAL